MTLEGRAKRQNRGRVDISVLNVNGVVIFAVFVHSRVDIDRGRTAVVDALIITRRSTKGSASIVTREASWAVTTAARAAEGSAAGLRTETLDPVFVVVILGNVEVVKIPIVVVVVVSVRLEEGRRTTEVRRPMRATGTSRGSEALDPIVVQVILSNVEMIVVTVVVVIVVVVGLEERRRSTEVRTVGRSMSRRTMDIGRSGRRSIKVRRRVHMDGSNHGRRVDVLVLDINRVIVSRRLAHISVEVASDRHVENLTLVITRRTALSSAAVGPATLDRKWTSTWAKSRTRVHIGRIDVSVLDLDRVVILAVLIHLRVSVDVGATVGTIEVAILIIARGSAQSSTANLRLEAVVVTGLNAIGVHL